MARLLLPWYDQEIPELVVPEVLIKYFNQMVDANSARNVDGEVVRICAYRWAICLCAF